MFQNVIFDLDGTLLNTIDDLADAANWVCARHGWPLHTVEEYKRFVGNGIPRLVERFAPAPERTPEGLARALEEFSERYGAHRADKTAPYAGMPEAVERLRAAGVRTAVLSNKAHALAGPVVEDYYPGQFPWVQGALPGLPTKPDPTLLHRLMEQFVADASHELKTPLTVILANAGILLAHSGDMADGQRKWVEYIQAEAQRMKSLVEDLLFLARSDDRRSPLRLQTVSFSDLAWEALLPFESVAFEAGVALDSQITPDLELLGDPEQLRRLVAILVDNAVKYAGPRGSASLILRPQGDEAVLSVHNTGEPIPPEHLPRLFERFYRTDSDRARSQGGYGLGLSIAKSIVDGHRGRISVSSSAISGTLFTVRLPLPGRGLGHLRTRSLG